MNILTFLSLRGSFILCVIVGIVMCVAVFLGYLGFRVLVQEKWVRVLAASALTLGLESFTQVLVWRHDLWDQWLVDPLWMGTFLLVLHVSKPFASILLLITSAYLMGIDNPWRSKKRILPGLCLMMVVSIFEYVETFAWHGVPGLGLRLWAVVAFLFAAYKNLAPYKTGHALTVAGMALLCVTGLCLDGLSPVWVDRIGGWQGLLKDREATGTLYFFSHEVAMQIVAKTVLGFVSLLLFGAGYLLAHRNLMLVLPGSQAKQGAPLTDFHQTAASVREKTGAALVALWTRDPGKPGEEGHGSVTDSASPLERRHEVAPGGVLHHVIGESRMVASRDARGETLALEFSDAKIGSLLALPILFETEVVGCLYLEWTRPHAFTATTLAYLQRLIVHLVPALQGKRQMLAFERVATDLNRVEGDDSSEASEKVVEILTTHVGPSGIGLHVRSEGVDRYFWGPDFKMSSSSGQLFSDWVSRAATGQVRFETVSVSEQPVRESLVAMAFASDRCTLIGNVMFRQVMVSMVAKMLDRVAMRQAERNMLDLEAEKLRLESEHYKLQAETSRLEAENVKIEERLLAHDRPALLMHEVKNQMAIVTAALSNLDDDIAFKEYDKLTPRLAVVKDAVKSISGLAAGFLPAPGAGTSEEKVTIGDVVTGVLHRYGPFLRSREIEVQVDGGMDVVVAIPYDTVLVALQNLIVNAVDAVQGQSSLVLKCMTRDNRVFLSVSNTGEIPEDAKSRLFLEGYTTKKSGSGMGLFLCLRAMKRSRGDILVESGNGKTTFTLQMPVEVFNG